MCRTPRASRLVERTPSATSAGRSLLTPAAKVESSMHETTAKCALIGLLAGALAGCGASSAVRTYNDPFEGPVRGFVLYLDRSDLTAISVHESHGTFKLKVMLVNRGQFDHVVPPGTPLELRVGNQILALSSSDEARPVSNVFGYTVITQWQVPAVLTREQAAILATEPLIAIRTTIGSDPYVLQLSRSHSETVMENMRTMTQPPS